MVGLTALFLLVLVGCTKETPKQESTAEWQARITKETADAAERQRLQREREFAAWVAEQKAEKEKKAAAKSISTPAGSPSRFVSSNLTA